MTETQSPTETTTTRDGITLATYTIHPTRQSTGITDTLTIVQHVTDLTCCVSQSKVWTVDQRLSVWDTTGTGTWDTQPHGQCGQCGSLHQPTHRLLHAPTGAEIATATADLFAAITASRDVRVEAVTARLTYLLRQAEAAVADADDIAEALDAAGIDWTYDGSEPGIMVDPVTGELSAWDFDPRDPGSIIEVWS